MRRSPEVTFKALNERGEVDLARDADRPNFMQGETSFARFILADEALGPVDLPSHVSLRQTGLEADRPQEGSDDDLWLISD